MNFPVVILGAGASFDYIHENEVDTTKLKFRPPLTRELFSTRIRTIAKATILEHPSITNLFGEINSGLRAGKDFEEYLREVRGRSVEREKQIISLQYYLHDLFQLISKNYGQQIGNNYGILVQRIIESFDEACFVTFNYDTLLEQSLFPDQNISDIGTFISGPHKLVKVHGSCDWVYSTPSDLKERTLDEGIYQFLIDNPDSAESIRGDKNIIVETQSSDYYPAIAIPIAGKDESDFVCPTEHTSQLIEALSKTDRILVVGWGAGDPALVKLIRKHVNIPVDMYLACGGQTRTIDAIKGKFKDMDLVTIKETRSNAFTFSEFLNNQDCDSFMAQ